MKGQRKNGGGGSRADNPIGAQLYEKHAKKPKSGLHSSRLFITYTIHIDLCTPFGLDGSRKNRKTF